MRRVAVLVIALAWLTGCGGDDTAPDKADGSVEVAPTSEGDETEAGPDLLEEACDSVLRLAPSKAPGNGWAKVLAEAEYYSDSDDAEVRSLMYDAAEAIRPMHEGWQEGMTQVEWDRIMPRFQEDWGDIVARCP